MWEADSPIPEGYHPPFAIITENDHSGYLIIACALGIALVTLSIIIRIFLRSGAFGHGFGTDDAFLFVATTVAFVQSTITWVAAGKGLGSSIDIIEPSKIPTIQQTFYATHILTIIALALTKCSLGFFILRLIPLHGRRRIVWFIMGFTAVWMMASVFAMALQCDLTEPWVLTGGVRCPGAYTRVLVIGIFDNLTELALVGVILWMVANIKAAMRTKLVVVMAFAFRLPLIPFTTLRITHFHQPELTSNFTLDEAMYIVWTQISVYYSLVSATIPSLRPFVHSLTTHYGGGFSSSDPSNHAKISSSDSRLGIQLSNLSDQRVDAVEGGTLGAGR